MAKGRTCGALYARAGSVTGSTFESADEEYSDELVSKESKVFGVGPKSQLTGRLNTLSLLRLGVGLRGMRGSNQGETLAGAQRTEGEGGMGGTRMKGRSRFWERRSVVGSTAACLEPCFLRLHRTILQTPMIMMPTTRKEMKPIRPAVVEGS